MVCDWPGYYSLYKDRETSIVYDRFALIPYPVGPAGTSLSYGGGHTFALTKRGIDDGDALRLLLFLTDFDQQLLEARHGCVPVRRSVMSAMQIESNDDDRARLAMLDNVISEHILIPPKFAQYPDVEAVLWRTVQSAIVGHISVDKALRHITEQIQHIVTSGNGDLNGLSGKKEATVQSRLL